MIRCRFSLINNEYKPVVYPLVYELDTWRNWKKDLSETKAHNQIKLNHMRNNKVYTISEIGPPFKIMGAHVSL